MLLIHSRMFIPENIPPPSPPSPSPARRRSSSPMRKECTTSLLSLARLDTRGRESRSRPNQVKYWKLCTKNPFWIRNICQNRNDLEKVLKHLPDYVNEQYVTAAFAKSMWDRIKSAVKCTEKFAIHTNTHIEWPMSKPFFCTPSQTGPLAQRIFHTTL